MRKHKQLLALLLAAAVGCTGSSQSGSGKTTTAGTTTGTGTATETGTEAAPPAPAKATKVRTIEGITEYTLPNGLRVLLFPDDSQAKVTVNITYFVGSRHEGYGEAGMAHLLEHMVFKGTPNHPNIWGALEDHGASFNGTTWTDRTNYYETLPASDENLEFALHLEADRMVNSNIDQAVLDKEFSVVRNEFEMGENDPSGVLLERMHSAAFLWHNYGKSTIGNRSDIERVPATSLRRFYQKYYQPDNAMLVVAGRFDEAAALSLIEKHFGALPKPARTLEPTYTVEPQQDGERNVVLRRTGDVQIVGVLYHGPPGVHVDYVPLAAVTHLLTNEPSGRLYKALVETGMATDVSGFSFAWHDPGTVMFFATVPKDRPLEPVRDKMISIIEGVDPKSITDVEVARYKNRESAQIDLAMTKSDAIAVELSEWAAMGDWRLMFLNRDRVAGITTDDVRGVANKYFKRSNRTVGMFLPTEAPTRAPLPEAPNVAAMVDGYQGREALAAGEKFEATVDNVEARTERVTLANGMQVAMLPKSTRGGAVRVTMTIRFGSEKELRGKTAAMDLIPQMLMRGTAKRDYQQLKDELDRLKAKVDFGGAGGGFGGATPGSATVTITTVRDNLPAVLTLVAEIFRTPAFPKDQFDIVVKEELTGLEEQRQDPFPQGIIAMSRAMMPYGKKDIRYVPTTDEQIARVKKVKVGDLRAYHKRFYGAENAQMTIVGDFDPGRVRGVLDEHYATWTAKAPYKRIDREYVPTVPADETVVTPDKKMAIVAVAQTVELRDDDPDYPAMVMAGYILGGGGKSRLLERLRQKEGLSYGAFGGVMAGALDRSGIMFAAAICASQNAEKAQAVMLEEVTLLVEQGVTDEELAEAKAAYAKQFAGDLASDEFLANTLNGALRLGRTLAYHKDRNAKIAALTADQVNAAMRKYIKVASLAKVKAGDLGK